MNIAIVAVVWFAVILFITVILTIDNAQKRVNKGREGPLGGLGLSKEDQRILALHKKRRQEIALLIDRLQLSITDAKVDVTRIQFELSEVREKIRVAYEYLLQDPLEDEKTMVTLIEKFREISKVFAAITVRAEVYLSQK